MNQSNCPPPVNAPLPVRVSTDADGKPVMVQIKTRKLRVHELCRQWVEPSPLPAELRKYYLVRLQDGDLCCVFHAPDQGRWYRQRISQKHWSSTKSADPAHGISAERAPPASGTTGNRARLPVVPPPMKDATVLQRTIALHRSGCFVR